MGHAAELAARMYSGLKALPPPERRKQCSVRCAEAWEGVQQINRVLNSTEEALHLDRWQHEGALGAFSQRLVWASEMSQGLRQGLEVVESCDPGGKDLVKPYRALSICLAECEEFQMHLKTMIDSSLESQRRVNIKTCPVDDVPCKVVVNINRTDVASTMLSSKHLQDTINDIVADEIKLLFESLAWLFRPIGSLYDLLAPTTMPASIGSAGTCAGFVPKRL